MRTLILLFSALFTILQSAKAQSVKGPEQDALIEKLKVLSSSMDYGMEEVLHEFSFKQDDNMLIAKEIITESVINLKPTKMHYVTRLLFFDDQSEVDGLRASPVKGSGKLYLYEDKKQIEQGGIFYSDASVFEYGYSLSKENMQGKYSVVRNYLDSKYLTRVLFHDNCAIAKKVLQFEIPDWANIELKEFNFEGWDVEHKTEKKDFSTVHTYTLKDLAPISNENNAANVAMEYPHILVLCKSFKDSDTSKEIALFKEVADLYSWYHGLASSVENNRTKIKAKAEELVQGLDSEEEKIEKIFYWVQDNIRYIAFENGIMGFKPEAADSVLQNLYGDCKGMANLTKEMLNALGFDARLTWIGTRGLPYDYTIPSLAIDNHMICTLNHKGKRYFLDATEKGISIDNYAHRIQGRPVMIEDGENYILDVVPEFGSENNVISKNFQFSIDGDQLKGKGNLIYTGEEKKDILNSYNSLKTEKKEGAELSFFRSINQNFVVDKYSFEGFDKRDGDVEVNFDLSWEHQVTFLGDELYLSLDPDRDFNSYTIKKERSRSVVFGNKFLVNSKTSLSLPATHTLTYKPEDFVYDHPAFSVSFKSELQGNNLVETKVINIKDGEINKANFEQWNEMIKGLTERYNQTYVLSKK